MEANNKELAYEVVGYLSAFRRQDVLRLLAKNGVVLQPNMTSDEVLTAVYTAMPRSKAFRQDLYNLAVQQRDVFTNYVEGDFMNQSGKEKKELTEEEKKKKAELWDKLLNTGFTAVNTFLTAQANKGSEKRAIEYSVAQTQASYAKTQEEEARKQALAERNKWLVPLAVIVGLGIVGVGAYYLLRKKK